MWEHFTDHAKHVVAYAREAAEAMHHDSLQIDHLLLGICLIPDCVAARVLTRLGANLDEIIEKMDGQSLKGAPDVSTVNLRFAQSAVRAITRAVHEARGMRHNYLGTEHILLGILGEDDSHSVRVLQAYGINLSDTRSQVHRLLNEHMRSPEGEVGTPPDSR